MSSHPWHGPSCSSVAYPWSCPECSTHVYVYTCSCGSWMMFDELGEGWPKHNCFKHAYAALAAKVAPILKAGADARAAKHTPFAGLAEKLDLRKLSTGVAEPETPFTPAFPPPAQPGVEYTIKKMEPVVDGEVLHMLGVVREAASTTAHIEQAYDALGDLGRKVWGMPAKTNAVQITIVETGGQPNESYTAICDRALLDKSVAPGAMVGVTLTARVGPSAKLWLITDLQTF